MKKIKGLVIIILHTEFEWQEKIVPTINWYISTSRLDFKCVGYDCKRYEEVWLYFWLHVSFVFFFYFLLSLTNVYVVLTLPLTFTVLAMLQCCNDVRISTTIARAPVLKQLFLLITSNTSAKIILTLVNKYT